MLNVNDTHVYDLPDEPNIAACEMIYITCSILRVRLAGVSFFFIF